LKEQITDVSRSLDSEANKYAFIVFFVFSNQKMEGSILQELNLPSSLEALEKSIGLPASLLGKAEEVRINHGPERIEKMIHDTQSLAQHNAEILNKAYMVPFIFSEMT
jgi:hypothetical protein